MSGLPIGLLMVVLGALMMRAANAAPTVRAERVALTVYGVLLLVLGSVGSLLLAAALLINPAAGDEEMSFFVKLVVLVGCFSLLGLLITAGALAVLLARSACPGMQSEPAHSPDGAVQALRLIGGFFVLGGLVFAMGLLCAALPLVLLTAFIRTRRRATDQENLLWALAVAAEHGMPLAGAVYSFADQYRGSYRRRVLALAEQLEAGASLPDALEYVRGVLPDEVALSARVGWQSGLLARALRDAAVVRAQRQPLWHAMLGRLGYIVFLIIWVQAIAGFILYFIAPKFKRILMDFGVDVPATTEWLFHVSTALGRSVLPPLVALAEVILLPYLVLAFWGRVPWRVPLVDRLLVRRDTAAVLRELALVVEAQRPLREGLEMLALWYPRRWVRKRIEHVLCSVTEGKDWLYALRTAGLLSSSDAVLLQTSQRAGNLAWALREAAEASERRLGYRLQAYAQLLFPAAVLCVGGLVFLIAVAYFGPLVRLIQQLSIQDLSKQ